MLNPEIPKVKITVELEVSEQAAAVKGMIKEGIQFFEDHMVKLATTFPEQTVYHVKKAITLSKEFSSQIDQKIKELATATDYPINGL